MIVDGFATFLHHVERLRLPVSGEILVDARRPGFARDGRVVRHGSLLPVFLHLGGVPRPVKLVRQVDPVHARIVQPERLVARPNVVVALLRRLFVLVLGIAQPLVVVPHVLRRIATVTAALANLPVVTVAEIFLLLLEREILTTLLSTSAVLQILRRRGALVLLRDVQLLLRLLHFHLSVKPLLLADLLHDGEIPMVDLGGFSVPLKSYGEIWPGLGHLLVFHVFVRLGDSVVRWTGRKLDYVDVAVSMTVSTAVRLMNSRLGVQSRWFGTCQPFLVVSIGNLKRRETEPIQDRGVARVNRLEVGYRLFGCDYRDGGARQEHQRTAE